jgi:hypothetical protein
MIDFEKTGMFFVSGKALAAGRGHLDRPIEKTGSERFAAHGLSIKNPHAR